MPLFSSGARARLAWRQSTQDNNNTCTTNEGVGECTPKANCPGVSTAGICDPGTNNIECCLVHVCNVREGHGVCRSMRNNGCEDGKFFSGTGKPWPCPGPNDISCCVKFADMNNGTSTTSSMSMTSSTFTTSRTSSPNTSSATSSSVPMPAHTGLSGAQIGGVAAGCAVFALLIILGATYFFRCRKASESQGEKPDTSDSGISEMPDSAGVAPRGPKPVVVFGELDSKEANELDSKETKIDESVAVNRARELDSTPISSPVELDSSPIEPKETKV
ncbi:hypothetical protein GTR04_2089 [Trichophyton interdigitale]|uniref:Uncharacterized protein n=1 Tax=Trichophyton interdigitale TaxID=101480 RepID=A0A9P4YI76_9EURO|nr:hypothetical protein GY631_1847 [Trichophyton interdigitale]KAF3898495.1 hypothetical protein GY632_1760 [Trichophyton interdigitale]KAG8210505.1 hypothetical protein GTR04_2089 [Trichophyton interdigitale]